MKFFVFGVCCLLCFQVKAQETFDLQTCISYGLKNHGSLNIAKNNEKSASASASEVLAGYLPSVTLHGGIDDNLKVQEQVIPAGVFSDEDMRIAFTKQFNTSGTVELNQTLYDHSLIIGLRARKFYTKQAELETEQTKEDLVYNISAAYYQVLVYQLQLTLLDESKETYAEQVRISQLQVEKGVLAGADLKKIQVDYHNTLSQIRIAETNLFTSMNALKKAIGYPLEKEMVIVNEMEKLPENYFIEVPDLSGFNPVNRIDYQLDSVNIALLAIDYKSVKNANLPVLKAYAKYGTIGFGDDLSESFQSQQTFSSIGIQMNATLFEGLGKRARAMKAKMKYENAVEQQKLDKIQYEVEVKNARFELVAAKARIEEELQNISLSEAVFTSTNLQYQKGVASLRDWLEDQLALKQAQNNYLKTVVDYYVATLELEKSSGALKNYLTLN